VTIKWHLHAQRSFRRTDDYYTFTCWATDIARQIGSHLGFLHPGARSDGSVSYRRWFQVLAKTLGIDLARFKRDERNEKESSLPVPQTKNRHRLLSVPDNGRFNCFVCLKGFSGRGAIDFVKLMQTVDFQETTEFLTALR
jgi:hypothetical protein